ncbi:FAD-dependent oxidoreductase [Chitinophaga rhizophila]|uniref:FAD-dependent oxidoreductase n=1 Tax=Chitinophaga rhizophila TaxID=2866212 RepID=A0ABS7G971_9BACT|nr:FAD-dependent oxidoreductase [Chitinophaga rhizophila]MBW8683252.1 FAD-dependent oxidoreductase [Chitinophaga rhizophila]
MKYLIALCLSCSLSFTHTIAQTTTATDIVIYGGTSAAITAAVQASKMHKSVVVVSPDKHLGGLSSGGLGFTDTGNKEVIGGLAREFYHRIYQHYQQPGAWNWQQQSAYGNKGQGTAAIDGTERTMWIFEPHVAEKVFEDFVKEYGIKVIRNEWLDREKGVIKKANRITAIKTLSGNTYEGKMFIDATYEGDLMAAAGVSYRVGREGVKEFGEEWAGVQTDVFHHGHHFKKPVSAYKIPGDATSGLLPQISALPPGEKGSGDNKIQAYCFRLCLTDLPANRMPVPRPAGYDSTQYALLLRVFETGWNETFNKFDPIPNHKTDVNNHGPFSMDYIGMNYDYPEATYEKRKEIIAAHQTYQQGLLYFIGTDARVPEQIRNRMKEWGLARDEFKDNNHWPHQLYIREARRLKGRETMTENEVLGKKPVSQSVGMGSYTLDSHNTQRYVQADGTVQNEGDIGIEIPVPYRISYGAIVPEKQECNNLLVPVCLSCTHIAYGSVRMEPVFMILGQSAATAAAQAIDSKKAVQDISYDKLKTQLQKDKQSL